MKDILDETLLWSAKVTLAALATVALALFTLKATISDLTNFKK